VTAHKAVSELARERTNEPGLLPGRKLRSAAPGRASWWWSGHWAERASRELACVAWRVPPVQESAVNWALADHGQPDPAGAAAPHQVLDRTEQALPARIGALRGEGVGLIQQQVQRIPDSGDRAAPQNRS